MQAGHSPSKNPQPRSGRWRRGRLSVTGQRARRRCDILLARHGARAVFAARLMPLARTFASLPAGHARVPIARFTILTTLGCAIWAAGLVLAGMLLGASWEYAGDVLRIPLLLLGAATAAGILLKTCNRKEKQPNDNPKMAQVRAGDQRSCSLSPDASPPMRPALPCELQLSAQEPRNLQLDRTPACLAMHRHRRRAGVL